MNDPRETPEPSTQGDAPEATSPVANRADRRRFRRTLRATRRRQARQRDQAAKKR